MPTYISASLINDYISCSNKAYYRIFEKGEAIPTKYMLIGTLAHNAIEKFWNDRDSAVNYINRFRSPILSEADYSTAEGCVHNYFDNFQKFMTPKDEIEKNFKTKLHDDVYLVGKFDRISNGVIYDWKTSTKVPSSLEGDVQFIFYYDAYRRLYGEYPNAVFFASLTEGRLVPYSHSEFHRKELFDKVIPNLIRDIKNKNFKRDGIFKKGTCHFCSYKGDCLKGMKNDEFLHSREFTEE